MNHLTGLLLNRANYLLIHHQIFLQQFPVSSLRLNQPSNPLSIQQISRHHIRAMHHLTGPLLNRANYLLLPHQMFLQQVPVSSLPLNQPSNPLSIQQISHHYIRAMHHLPDPLLNRANYLLLPHQMFLQQFPVSSLPLYQPYNPLSIQQISQHRTRAACHLCGRLLPHQMFLQLFPALFLHYNANPVTSSPMNTRKSLLPDQKTMSSISVVNSTDDSKN